MEIYSSETGAWTYRQIEWGDGTVASWNSVFFKGTLHLTSPDSSSLLTVDIDANKWREIPTPRDFDFIGVSQGQLHAVHISNRYINNNNKERLSIWVLEDYAGQQWTLKHEVSARQMFGTLPRSFGGSCNFNVHAIHPDSGAWFDFPYCRQAKESHVIQHGWEEGAFYLDSWRPQCVCMPLCSLLLRLAATWTLKLQKLWTKRKIYNARKNWLLEMESMSSCFEIAVWNKSQVNFSLLSFSSACSQRPLVALNNAG